MACENCPLTFVDLESLTSLETIKKKAFGGAPLAAIAQPGRPSRMPASIVRIEYGGVSGYQVSP